MKHLKQVIEEGKLNDEIKLFLNCHKTIDCIRNNEVVDVPVGDFKGYEVEEVGEIELDEDSGFELVSVRTHIANLRLAYDPDYEVIDNIVDETEFVEELGIGVFDGVSVDNIVEHIKDSFKSLFPSPEVDKILNNMITVDKQKITIELPS